METVESILTADSCDVFKSDGLPSPLLPLAGIILPSG